MLRDQLHVDAFGGVHVPAVPLPLETHFAGAKHGGPFVGSESHAAPSAAAATHVPLTSVGAAFLQRPPAPHTAKPVIGALPIAPHVAFAETIWMFWHVPTALPFAAGMHTRPMSAKHPGAVLRVPSHAAPTVAPEVWHVPVFIVASSSPTHDRPAWQGW
jgi:hypothetical protein